MRTINGGVLGAQSQKRHARVHGDYAAPGPAGVSAMFSQTTSSHCPCQQNAFERLFPTFPFLIMHVVGGTKHIKGRPPVHAAAFTSTWSCRENPASSYSLQGLGWVGGWVGRGTVISSSIQPVWCMCSHGQGDQESGPVERKKRSDI